MNSGPGEAETGTLKIGLATLAGTIHDRDCRIWMAMTGQETEMAVAELLSTTVTKTKNSGNLSGIFDRKLWEAITVSLGRPRLKSGTGVLETGSSSSGQQL